MKRILTRLGLGKIRKKLKELEEEYGMEVLEINPAYRSQSYSSCGYVDKGNRKRMEEFRCKVCGRKLHADVKGSLNLKERFLEGVVVYVAVRSKPPLEWGIGFTRSGSLLFKGSRL